MLGENRIPVPTHLYKVALGINKQKLVLKSFMVENKPIRTTKFTDINSFEVSLRQLQIDTGFKFFPLLSNDVH